MTNPAPLVYGSYYHIYNRGINRENIFVEEENYYYFLKLIGHHLLLVVDVFAYCLLRNHFHLLIRIKTEDEILIDLTGLGDLSGLPNPSQRFSNLFNAYAKAFNKRNRRTGSLFQRPFGRVEITTNTQLIHIVTYIHQNPEKHGLVDDFRDWPYSSYQAFYSEAKGAYLKHSEVLGWFGEINDFEQAHQMDYKMKEITSLFIDDKD